MLKIGLLKGRVGLWALTSKIGVLKGIWICVYGVKSVYIKYECSSNLVSIGHWMDASRHLMPVR